MLHTSAHPIETQAALEARNGVIMTAGTVGVLLLPKYYRFIHLKLVIFIA